MRLRTSVLKKRRDCKKPPPFEQWLKDVLLFPDTDWDMSALPGLPVLEELYELRKRREVRASVVCGWCRGAAGCAQCTR